MSITGKVLNHGTISTTEQQAVFTAHQPTRLLGLSMHNVSGADCWVKTFWKDTQESYTNISANEVTRLYTDGETLGSGEQLGLQVETAGSISYVLRGEADA